MKNKSYYKKPPKEEEKKKIKIKYTASRNELQTPKKEKKEN
jgi:hypothetical protein